MTPSRGRWGWKMGIHQPYLVKALVSYNQHSPIHQAFFWVSQEWWFRRCDGDLPSKYGFFDGRYMKCGRYQEGNRNKIREIYPPNMSSHSFGSWKCRWMSSLDVYVCIYIYTLFCVQYIWLVVYLPLWKIWKSVGIVIPNIWKNKKNDPNHQPDIYIYRVDLTIQI